MTGTAAFPGAPTEKCEQRIHPPIEALAVARDKVRTSFVGAAHEPEAVEDELRREPAAAWVSIKNLREWKDNPRKNDPAVAAVAESIKRFGFGAPIIARLADGEVIAGHTRLKAAIKLGLSEVPVRYLDLDPADAHLLALADNKTSEIAAWDDEALGRILAELRAKEVDLLAGTGFGEAEIDALIRSTQGLPCRGHRPRPVRAAGRPRQQDRRNVRARVAPPAMW